MDNHKSSPVPKLRLFIESAERLMSADWIEACFNDWDLQRPENNPEQSRIAPNEDYRQSMFEGPCPYMHFASFKEVPEHLNKALRIRQEPFGGLLYQPTTAYLIQLDTMALRMAKMWQAKDKSAVRDMLMSDGLSRSQAEGAVMFMGNQILSLRETR